MIRYFNVFNQHIILSQNLVQTVRQHRVLDSCVSTEQSDCHQKRIENNFDSKCSNGAVSGAAVHGTLPSDERAVDASRRPRPSACERGYRHSHRPYFEGTFFVLRSKTVVSSKLSHLEYMLPRVKMHLIPSQSHN
jgi:hypothetical protein